jgi:hypothetical protein
VLLPWPFGGLDGVGEGDSVGGVGDDGDGDGLGVADPVTLSVTWVCGGTAEPAPGVCDTTTPGGTPGCVTVTVV